MTTLNTNKPRRKLATYGKSYKSRFLDYNQARTTQLGHPPFTTLVSESARTTELVWGQRGTSAEEKRTCIEGPAHLTQTSLDSGGGIANARILVPNKTSIPREVTAACELEPVYSLPTGQRTPPRGLTSLSVFDVSLSDDNGHPGQARLQVKNTWKRRKLKAAANGDMGSVPTDSSLQPQSPLEEIVDKGEDCQNRYAQSSTTEQLKSRKHTSKSTRTPEKSGSSRSGSHSTRTSRNTAPVNPHLSSKDQIEQQVSTGKASRVHYGRLRTNPTLVPATLQAIISQTDQGKAFISKGTQPSLSTTSDSRQATPSLRKDSCGDAIITLAETCTVTQESRRRPSITPPYHVRPRDKLSGNSDRSASKRHVHTRDGEGVFVFTAGELSGDDDIREDSQKFSGTRHGATKVIDAMKQHRTSRTQRSSKAQGIAERPDHKTHEWDIQGSSQSAMTLLENSASGSSQSTDPSQIWEPGAATSQAAPTSPNTGPKVTYARQRSYLTEDALAGDADFSIPIDVEQGCRQARRRGADRKGPPISLPGLISLEEESDVDNSSVGGIRSIHELREAGEKHKFEHGIQSLLDEIEANNSRTMSQKRSSLLNLAMKLSVAEFTFRFTECGLEQRLFGLADPGSDPITKFLLASAIMFLLCNNYLNAPTCYVQSNHLKDFLVLLLTADEDIATLARDRRVNMSRASRSDVLQFRTLVEQSPVWRCKAPAKISSQVVALTVLEFMVRQAQEAGDCTEFVLHSTVEHLVQISELQRSKLADLGASDYDHVTSRLALTILDVCTSKGMLTMNDRIVWSAEFLSKLANLLPPTSEFCGGDTMEFRNLVLRLYLNLTNNNPSLCDSFSQSGVINAIFGIIHSHFQALFQETVEDKGACLLDNLILSLGTLINVAEWSDAARLTVLTPRIGTLSTLEQLLRVFLDRIDLASKVSKPASRIGALVDHA